MFRWKTVIGRLHLDGLVGQVNSPDNGSPTVAARSVKVSAITSRAPPSSSIVVEGGLSEYQFSVCNWVFLRFCSNVVCKIYVHHLTIFRMRKRTFRQFFWKCYPNVTVCWGQHVFCLSEKRKSRVRPRLSALLRRCRMYVADPISRYTT